MLWNGSAERTISWTKFPDGGVTFRLLKRRFQHTAFKKHSDVSREIIRAASLSFAIGEAKRGGTLIHLAKSDQIREAVTGCPPNTRPERTC